MVDSRIPGWTDRILYRTKNPTNFKQVSYDSINCLKQSDHRPVFSQFELTSEVASFKASSDLIERVAYIDQEERKEDYTQMIKAL